MKKIKSIILVAVMALAMTSCYTLEHTVGTGAQGNSVAKQKQWYALFGAVPINNVDSKQMAGEAENYTIKSQVKFVDYVISAFTNIVTVTVQTVEVKK
jgi:PBP1b-binding outer membrane lipoprotein LpoB